MSELIKALAVTAELTQTELSKSAYLAMEQDLRQYPQEQVFAALIQCRRELTGHLTLASIIDRIDDGRLKADEAWSIAVLAMDENATVVMNDEIAEAMTAAKAVFMQGDEVGARMAFRSAYERITRDKKGLPVKWWPSLGHDKGRREQVLIEAVEKGRLSLPHVLNIIPLSEEKQLALANLTTDQKSLPETVE